MKRDETGQGIKFERLAGRGESATIGQSCYVCDELRADALDDVLSAPEQQWFDAHLKSCTRCAESFADAGRGLAWLALLKTAPPEPAADLVERILAQTSLAQTASAQTSLAQTSLAQTSGLRAPGSRSEALTFVPAAPAASARGTRGKLLRFPLPSFALPRFGGGAGYDSRLAMTAAMAFFSITLTLSLSGVRLDRIQTGKLTPRGVEKRFYEADARVVRFYDGLRVVRTVESRLSDLRDVRGDDTTQKPGGPADAGKPGGTSEPKRRDDAPGGGVSQRDEGAGASDRLVSTVRGEFGQVKADGSRFSWAGLGVEGTGV